MADTAKQSPLGVNSVSTLLVNEGLSINPNVRKYLGASKTNNTWQHGELVKNTVLRLLTYSITDAYRRGEPGNNCTLTGSLIITVPSATGKLIVDTLDSGRIMPGQTITSPDIDKWGIPYSITVVSQVGTSPTDGGSGSEWVVVTDLSDDYPDITFIGTPPYPVTVSDSVYDNLLNIGQSRIPALGNSKPPTFIANDPSGQWSGQATTGYAVPGQTGHGQQSKWMDWNSAAPNNGVTQAGFLRLLAYQAWNEFNWNGNPPDRLDPEYKNYTMTFNAAKGFVSYVNDTIMSMRNSKDFLKGTFSNMNDLITADVSGVSLSTQAFGQDLINLGKALNLAKIDRFGLPSALLEVLQINGAVPGTLNLTMLSAGLNLEEINVILATFQCTKLQEQQLYTAMQGVDGEDFAQTLQTLQCRTPGLNNLADLLNVKKIFPISYSTLTTPIYNTAPGPTNAKTYYLLFINGLLNPQLLNPAIQKTIGTIVPPEEPVVTPPPEEPPVAPVVPKVNVNIGGGGTNFSVSGGGGCVVLDAYLPTIEKRTHNDRIVERAWQYEPTFDIMLANEELISKAGKVVGVSIDYQPCVKIITSSGIRLSCSTTAPILTKDKGYVVAPKLFGERVAVMRNDIAFWDEIVGIEDIGYKHVRVIDTGDNSFWAGDIHNAYILHHNSRIEEQSFKFDKK